MAVIHARISPYLNLFRSLISFSNATRPSYVSRSISVGEIGSLEQSLPVSTEYDTFFQVTLFP